MAPQYGTAVRNARLDVVETTIGVDPILRMYTGSKPSAPADSATGTLLVAMTLPTDWLAAASGGTKAKSGTWSSTGSADGVAGYYRIYESTGTTCHEQGTITITGGGGDMTLDNTNIATGQTVVVSSFTKTEGNA